MKKELTYEEKKYQRDYQRQYKKKDDPGIPRALSRVMQLRNEWQGLTTRDAIREIRLDPDDITEACKILGIT